MKKLDTNNQAFPRGMTPMERDEINTVWTLMDPLQICGGKNQEPRGTKNFFSLDVNIVLDRIIICFIFIYIKKHHTYICYVTLI